MMKFLPIQLTLLIAMVAVALLAGCATQRDYDPSVVIQPWDQEPSETVVIGRVVLADMENGFAVVESPSGYNIEAGTQLKVPGASGREETVLVVSEEKRRPFLVAKIISGRPSQGDQVTMRVRKRE